MDGMLVQGMFTRSIKFPGTHVYTYVEWGTLNATQWLPSGLDPGTLDPEFTLTLGNHATHYLFQYLVFFN